jgi:hypothetical protein
MAKYWVKCEMQVTIPFYMEEVIEADSEELAMAIATNNAEAEAQDYLSSMGGTSGFVINNVRPIKAEVCDA